MCQVRLVVPVALVPLLAMLVASTAAAQEAPASKHELEVIGGLGISIPREKEGRDGDGRGGFVAAEYVFLPRHVFSLRLYAGAVVTLPNDSSCRSPPCDTEAQIGFTGAKVRVMAPIPWVGPYLELGLGASVGYMRTYYTRPYYGTTDETLRGATFHIPFALGLALGRQHEFDVAFSYLFHPAQSQVVGAVAVGLKFAVP